MGHADPNYDLSASAVAAFEADEPARSRAEDGLRKRVTVKYKGFRLDVEGLLRYDDIMEDLYLEDESIEHEGEDIWELMDPKDIHEVMVLADAEARK